MSGSLPQALARTRLRGRWLVGLLAALLLGWGLFEGAIRLVPLPVGLTSVSAASVQWVDRAGRPLRVQLTEPGQPAANLPFSALPAVLVQATVAAEDRRFWDHHGVDWLATARAAWDGLRHRRVVSGASTITQQLIKLSHPRPRTPKTKLLEALQALRLETEWSKERILAAYLDRLQYGNLCVGPAQAARFYFGQPLAGITPAQAALLAGLPQAPTRLNPVHHLDRARRRQAWVIGQMVRAGYLSGTAGEAARAEPLRLTCTSRPFRAAHFVDLVQRFHGDLPPHDALGRVQTTLDLPLQEQAEGVIRRQLAGLADRHVTQGAVVILDNPTGEVLAMVGSRDYFDPAGGQVNGAWMPRSPGSALKPFTYLLAFERGATAATVLADVPVEFATPTGIYRPVNYNRQCYGPLRARQALANSLNIPAVRLLDWLGGPTPLVQALQRLGLTTLDQPAGHYGLGLTLGNAEVRLLELANAYATLARLGEHRPWRLLAGPSPSASGGVRLADSSAAWLVADILADNQARALAFGTDTALRFDFPVACKTGTSTDYRDNWAFGYTPEFTVGVWVGNFDGSPMREVSGVTGAAPMLHDLMAVLHSQKGTTWYAPPSNLATHLVHPLTGKRLGTTDARGVRDVFLPPHEPEPEQPSDYDPAGRVRLPAEYAEWFRSAPAHLAASAVVDTTASGPLRVLSPLPGTIFYLDPDLPPASQVVPLHAEGGTGVQWNCDTLVLRQTNGLAGALLTPGRHTLRLVDPATRAETSTWIEVRRL